MEPVQILIADPHPLVRDIIAGRMGEEKDFQVIGAAASGGETLQAVSRHNPDILLLDLDFQDMYGLKVIYTLRECNNPVRIIVVGSESRPEFIRCVLDAGADVYILKEEATDLLVDAVKRLSGGEKGWFRPGKTRK
jgi:DNA-binding NarL/FixJ family response regulator